MKPSAVVVSLPVSDLECSLRFYRDGLGLETPGIDEYMIAFELPNLSLFLIEAGQYQTYVDRAGLARPGAVAGSCVISCAIATGDEIHEIVSSAVAAGGSAQPVAVHDGALTAYVQDPDRHVWELVHSQSAEGREADASTSGAVPDYVYVTYIRATPEQVWAALTDPELSGRFWGHSQVSDWQVGSRVDHVRIDGSGIADASGKVLEVDPPRRLVFGFDDPARFDDPTFEPSVVAFGIEQGSDIVKLTVTHTLLASMDEWHAVSLGWPAVLANLKTFLETGEALPQDPWEFHADERAAQMAKNG